MFRISLLALAVLLMVPMHILSDQEDPTVQTVCDQLQLNDEVKAKIAVIELVDSIHFKKAMLELLAAAKDPHVRGILVVISSDGGPIPQFSTIHDLIKKIKTIKPIVSFVVGSALSCGYLLASATDYIVANSGADIGHIGVRLRIERWKKAQTTGNVKADIEIENFSGGEFKDLYDLYAPRLTSDQRKHIKDRTDKSYQHFITTIAENRSLVLDDYKQWAEGKIFLASQALSMGLIDEIGTIFEVEQKLTELINARNQNCSVTDLEYNFAPIKE